MVENLKLSPSAFLKNKFAIYYGIHLQSGEHVVDFTKKPVITEVKEIFKSVPETISPVFRPLYQDFNDVMSSINYNFYGDLKGYFDFAISKSAIYSAEHNDANFSANISFLTDSSSPECFIRVSKYDGTNKYGLDLIHELGHYYQYYNQYLNKRRVEHPELVEVLPIFFEYLFLEKTSVTGFEDFVRNRTYFSLRRTDLYPFFSFINERKMNSSDKRNFSFILSEDIYYLIGFNYALSLIERRNQDCALVDDEIMKVLNGRKTSLEMANKLDIDLKNFNPLKKTLRKRRYIHENK